MKQSRLPRRPRRSIARCVNVSETRSLQVLLSKMKSILYYFFYFIMHCSVYGCSNSMNTRPDLSYFKHPSDEERRKKWLELIGRPELIIKPPMNCSVCEEHFRVQDVLHGKRKTLKINTCPALKLPQHLQPESVEEDLAISIKSEIMDEPEEILPDFSRKRKSESPLPSNIKIEKIEEPQQENKLLVVGSTTFQNLCTKFLTKDLADLAKAQVSFQINLAEISKQKRNNKICLNLYLRNPQAYRMLQKVLYLPPPITFNFGPITTHMTSELMTMLENKVKRMSNQEKECSVAIKAVSLKAHLWYSLTEDRIIGFHDIDGERTAEPALNTYVIMVRGIFSDWKQLVGYALLSKGDHYVQLNEWIDGLLEKLVQIGFNIRTFVSGTENEFIKAAENRSVTTEKPYFFINNRKIYYIFEAPHLIKLIRNHFLLYDFVYQDRRAKFEHLKCFYNHDKKDEYKIAPKITNRHINPTNFDKMNLKYVTELFDNSVATGISTYVKFGYIDNSGRDTADFVKLMNNLFDSLNSSDLKDNDYQYKNAFRGNESQIDFFNEMLIYFQNLKLVHPKDGRDFTSHVKFIHGFQTTIKSVLLLFEDLKSEGYTYMLTRRLNLEVLDLFVDKIRTKYGMASEPTSWQLVSAFRDCFISNLIKPLKRKGTEKELSDFLTEIKKLKQTLSSKKGPSSEPNVDSSIKIRCSDYNQLELSDKNCIFQVSHYLLMKCAKIHVCAVFQTFFKPYIYNYNFINDDRYKLYSAYSNENCISLIVVPSDDFVQYVKNMDVTFVTCFRRICAGNNLVASLRATISGLRFEPPCPCFPIDYLINLFVRMRIYNVSKSNNKEYKSFQIDIKSMVVKCL